MTLIKATTALLADQVRREDNGKALIIGVYTGDVVLAAIPSDLSLAVWLELEFSDTSLVSKLDMELRLRIVGDDKSSDFETRRMYHIAREDAGTNKKPAKGKVKSVLVINGIPAQFRQEGKIEISMRSAGGRWKTVLEKEVLLGKQ